MKRGKIKRGDTVKTGVVVLSVDAVIGGLVYFHFYDGVVGEVYATMLETVWGDPIRRAAMVRRIVALKRLGALTGAA